MRAARRVLVPRRMRKHNTKKLSLSSTTVQLLTDRMLASAAGAALPTTTERTDGCPYSVMCTSHLFLCP